MTPEEIKYVVQAIQTKVNELGAIPPLVVDGVIGSATIAAIWETMAALNDRAILDKIK